ncbi:hypothetical protein KAF44_41245 [Cupriavidus necator]|nr:hypothetical protein KAF44_41245 [Cupriavidus necator]
MTLGWRTRAIGRHLVDLPAEAKTIESYIFDEDIIEPIPNLNAQADLNGLVAQEERRLRGASHSRRGSMFVERAAHANGSITLVSWKRPTSEIFYRFETYFCAGKKILKYSGDVSPSLKASALAGRGELASEWREIMPGETPNGVGYVVNDAILGDSDLNLESWRMVIQLPGMPDVSFTITSYTQHKVEPGLRDRAGGVLAALLGTVAGVAQLRNRQRPVGPIQADEILVAGTQDGKRTYGFKWEAPGKADSLAEPNLNVSLHVGESAYPTNKESFASDEEALELWDAVVGSIRLRPGAV